MPDKRVTAAQRRAVFARAKGCCEYCQSQARFATQSFAAEHIIPRYVGGTTTLDNLALSCLGCNSHKHTKTDALDPISGLKTPLFHPRQEAWSEHFCWDDDFRQIVGRTPTGRATVEALQLNRPELINLRRVLYLAGEHPLPGSSGDAA
jgi:hypothetical protein